MNLFSKAKTIIPDPLERPIEFGVKKTSGFLHEFRKFAIKGNAIDLAIGIVIGAAFTNIVNSLVKDVIMPIIGLVTGGIDFSNYYINLTDTDYATLADAELAGAAIIRYGTFINFVIIALVIFLVVKNLNKLVHPDDDKPIEKKPKLKQCPFCLEEVNINATRCKFCAGEIPFEKSKTIKQVQKKDLKPQTASF